VRRELRTRFLGSRFGWAWSLAMPLAILATYSVVFGIVLGADRGMPPSPTGLKLFAVYLFTGLVVWNVFSSVLQRSVDGLLELIPLRRKVAFPVIAPLVGMTMATVVERAVELGLLVVVLLLVGNIGWTVLWAPLIVALAAGFGFGLGLALSVLNVKFRDISHLIGVALQLLFFATPIIYPPDFVDRKFGAGSAAAHLLDANPVALYVTSLRETLWQLRNPSWGQVVAMVLVSTASLGLGWLVFRGRAAYVAEMP
jgi:ABC-2 type transport system permease protein